MRSASSVTVGRVVSLFADLEELARVHGFDVQLVVSQAFRIHAADGTSGRLSPDQVEFLVEACRRMVAAEAEWGCGLPGCGYGCSCGAEQLRLSLG